MRCARTMISLIALAAFLSASIATSNAAELAKQGDWPQWRGPNRDGISTETGLLPKWSEGGPEMLWTAKGLGAGHASITKQNGRIFTMGERDGKEHVFALNEADGKELWATPVGKTQGNGGYPGPRCSPTCDGDLIYAIGSAGGLVCCEAATGNIVWSKEIGKDFGGKMMSGWGYSESPLVDGDWLLCTPGGKDAMIVALNKKTGDEIWRTEMPDVGEKGKDGAAYSSIVITNGGGRKQYVQLVGRGVIGVDAKTGKLLWSYNKVANGTANIPTPIVSGDYVFCSTGYGTGSALLKLAPSGDGIVVEEQYFLDAKELQNHHGGMILLGDHLYCGHGHNNGFPICVEMKTGRTVWGGKERGPGTGSAAVAYADGKLYFRYQSGVMGLIEATPKGYNLISTFPIPEVSKPSWPHPVIADGKLYLREQDALHCYKLK